MTRALAVLELSAGLLCLVSISRTPSESPGPRVTLDASVVLPPSRRDRPRFASLFAHQSYSLQVAGRASRRWWCACFLYQPLNDDSSLGVAPSLESPGTRVSVNESVVLPPSRRVHLCLASLISP